LFAFRARETKKNADAEIESVKQTVEQNTQGYDAHPEDDHKFPLLVELRPKSEGAVGWAHRSHPLLAYIRMSPLGRLIDSDGALFHGGIEHVGHSREDQAVHRKGGGEGCEFRCDFGIHHWLLAEVAVTRFKPAKSSRIAVHLS
jgi:hypothetical protein